MVNWLHISDLHLGCEGAITNMMRDELPGYLRELGVKCDYVFCTGDIRTANVSPNIFTNEMAAYLKSICEAVQTSVDRLYIVPGNHDVNRDIDGRQDAIKKVLYAGNGYYKPNEGVIEQEDMSVIMAGEKDFVSFLGWIYDEDRLKLYGNPEKPHFNIETEHFNILHVNTNIAYARGQESNDLYVGTKFLYDAVRTLNKNKPTILLSHYPVTSLMQGEKKVLSTMLQHNRVRLWLAGHEHDQVLQKVHYIYSLQAGALRNEQDVRSSVLLGRYDPTTCACFVNAHTWFEEGWAKYPYVDLENTPQDVFSINLSPKLNDKVAIPQDLKQAMNGLILRDVNVDLIRREPFLPVIQSDNIIERTVLLDRCLNALDDGKILVIFGPLKIGKSTLVAQIHQHRPKTAIYDSVLQTDLENKIKILLQEGKGGESVLVSTGALNLNIAGLDDSRVCQIEVPLLTVAETDELVNTYEPEQNLHMLIHTLSCGHPVLVRTLCEYLKTNHWRLDEKHFSNLLAYNFDYNLSRAMADLMRTLLADTTDRALLNRLLIVNGTFTEEDACKLAGIDPTIDEPRMRLNGLVPTWVMPVDNCFKVNPLISKLWKPDVPEQTFKDANLVLAEGILTNKKVLGEYDVLNYILYSIRGGADDNAGRMYITTLMKLDDIGELPHGSLLCKLWMDIPLPERMSIDVKIGVRYLQIVLIKDLSATQRSFLIKDLKDNVSKCTDAEKIPFYSSMITMICWMEGDIEGGLSHYYQYLESKGDDNKLLKTIGDAKPVFDNNIWLFLLLLSNEQAFIDWLDKFEADNIEYSHNDHVICKCCYLAIERLWRCHLVGESVNDLVEILFRILVKAELKHCSELAIACVFAIMEIFNSERRYEEARSLYESKYPEYEEMTFAQLILNSSMGNSYFRDVAEVHVHALDYFKRALSIADTELIPNIMLHVKQMMAYVLAETDINAAEKELEEALQYVSDVKHRIDIYEYYQCIGELSYTYWCAGNRQKAIEKLSECVCFVTNDLLDGKEKFAKSFICLLGCLIIKYQCDLDNKPVPKDQAIPYHGMFTENDLSSFDDLYSEDRIYTSSYQMCQLCKIVGLRDLASEWAHRTLYACKKRGEVREIHYLLFLLLPYLIEENDKDAILFVINHTCEAQRISYENHPELHKENADFEFVEFRIVPLLMASLGQKLRGDDSGLKLIKKILGSYQSVNDSEKFELVKSVFNRPSYDKDYIAEINKLDMKDNYVVYICAYLMTAYQSEADYAFSLLIALLPMLEKQLTQILGEDIKPIINHFVTDFWKAKILTAPNEFKDYKHLREKGLPLIEEYEGKINQANHTMLIVSNHINQLIKLNDPQEDWMDM